MKHSYIYAGTIFEAHDHAQKNRLQKGCWTYINDPARLYGTKPNTVIQLVGTYKDRNDWPTIKRIMQERSLLGAEWF